MKDEHESPTGAMSAICFLSAFWKLGEGSGEKKLWLPIARHDSPTPPPTPTLEI